MQRVHAFPLAFWFIVDNIFDREQRGGRGRDHAKPLEKVRLVISAPIPARACADEVLESGGVGNPDLTGREFCQSVRATYSLLRISASLTNAIFKFNTIYITTIPQLLCCAGIKVFKFY